MRVCRISTPHGPQHVRAEGEMLIPIEDPYAALAAGRAPADLGAPVTGTMLAASDPLVVVGIAQNGPTHPSPVQAWLKSPRTVVPSGKTVDLRRDAGRTVAEGEVAVVIGRDTAGLTAETAHTYVLGVTAVNDLSSPDRADLDPRNYEGKGGEGYTPLACWIETEVDLAAVPLVLAIGDATVAETSSAALPIPIAQCLAYVAGWTRLGPGDIVMTGAPHSSGEVHPGQTMRVRVGSIDLVTPTR